MRFAPSLPRQAPAVVDGLFFSLHCKRWEVILSDLFARKGFERVLYFRFLASNGNCVLVSAHVQLSPCN